MDAAACDTSFDCGDLKCIDQVCRDPFAPVHHDAPTATLGHHMMFGTGEGYAPLIVLLDIGAALVEPFLTIAATTNDGSVSSTFGVLCFVPVGLTGSITHFAHGRVVPGIISFFAWTTAVGLTFSVAGLSGITANGNFNSESAWAVGLAFGSIAAASLTALDAWMARTIVPTRHASSFTIAPSIFPVRSGAFGAVGGTF